MDFFSVGSQKRSTKKKEPAVTDSLPEAFKNSNALSKPVRLAKRKKKAEALLNNTIKSRHINFAQNLIEKAKRKRKIFSPRKRSEATNKAKRSEQSELFFQN